MQIPLVDDFTVVLLDLFENQENSLPMERISDSKISLEFTVTHVDELTTTSDHCSHLK